MVRGLVIPVVVMSVLFAVTTTVAGAVGATMGGDVVTVVAENINLVFNRTYLRHVDLDRMVTQAVALPVRDIENTQHLGSDRLALFWRDTENGTQNLSVWQFRAGEITHIHAGTPGQSSGLSASPPWTLFAGFANPQRRWVFTDPYTLDVYMVEGDDLTKHHLLTLTEDEVQNTFAFPAWSPDGSTIVYHTSNRRHVVDPDDLRVTTLDVPQGSSTHFWTPDSRWYINRIYPQPTDPTTRAVLVVDTTTHEHRILMDGQDLQTIIPADEPCPPPANHLDVVVSGESLDAAAPFALARLSLLDGTVRLLSPLTALAIADNASIEMASWHGGCRRIRVVSHRHPSSTRLQSVDYDLDTQETLDAINRTFIGTFADGTNLVVEDPDADPVVLLRYDRADDSYQPFAEIT